MLAGITAGLVLGMLAVATAVGVPVALSLGTDTAAAAPAKARTAAADNLYLTIVTGEMTGSKLGPAYVPADFTVPAHARVTVHVVDFDGATPQKPAKYARVWGTVGGVETVQPIRGNDPNAAGPARTTSALDPATGVGHTFTVPGLHLNVPIAPDSVVTFTIDTGAPGTYHWQCFNPCGTGDSGWNGAMATERYMQGTLTVA